MKTEVLRTLSCVHGNKMDVCDICLGKPEAPADNVVTGEECWCGEDFRHLDCPTHGDIMDETPVASSDHVKVETQKEHWRELLEEVMQWHRDKESPDYNECDTAPCVWCEGAKQIIEKHSSVPDGNDAGAAPVNPNPPVSPQLPSGMEDIAIRASDKIKECYGLKGEHKVDLTDVILRAMQQAVEAAQNDKERLDWLDQQVGLQLRTHGEPEAYVHELSRNLQVEAEHPDLRMAIDNAMKSNP